VNPNGDPEIDHTLAKKRGSNKTGVHFYFTLLNFILNTVS